jgi:hypothetical protein
VTASDSSSAPGVGTALVGLEYVGKNCAAVVGTGQMQFGAERPSGEWPTPESPGSRFTEIGSLCETICGSREMGLIDKEKMRPCSP